LDAGRWQRVKSVLQDALDRPEGARSAFLDGACVDDPELRAEVESLLAANRDAGAFLSRPLATEPEVLEAQNREGRRIGPYLVVGQIGRGGMGVVYRAVRDDDVFHKVVALKLVLTGARSEHLLRLTRERQILARLEHPHIARILDGGATEDGEPYLVMEYFDGTPIDVYCERKSLCARERLEMFRVVCGAVHHAHQNLVVHRDLKPQNILVTPEGQPKLLDFGIAKLLAAGVDPDEAPTGTAVPLMTPEYASPEQVRGQPVTTASDVYSLGVVLFELLTRRLPIPIPTDSLEGIVRSVCETEPVLPSAAARASGAEGARPGASSSELRGDLDTILLKALRKEPMRRYLSAQELSEDIGRHLEGRPVRARNDTLGYRVGKFAGRHRAGVTAAILVLVSLFGGLAATFWQWRRAERRFADVRTLANSLLLEFDDAIKDLPGSTRARGLVVTRAVEYLDSLAREAGGDPALRRELAVAYHRIAEIQGGSRSANLGDSAGALASYRKALALQEALVSRDPTDPELRRELGRLLVGAGDVQQQVLDRDGARESYRKALAIQEVLSEGAPPDASARRDLASSLQGLAEVSIRIVDPVRAEENCRKAVAIRESVVAAAPNDDEARRELASSYRTLGDIVKTAGATAQAFELHHLALGILEGILERHPANSRNRSDVASSQMQTGNDLVSLGDLAGALEHLRKAVAMLEQMARADPSNAQARWLQGLALNTVGDALRESGRGVEAVQSHEGAVALFEELTRADPTNDSYHYNLANTCQLLGEAYEGLASKAATAEEKRERWGKAQSWFARSAELFRGLRARGTMSAQLTPDADRVDLGLATSKAALAKLAATNAAALPGP